jgi:hypothetical protein
MHAVSMNLRMFCDSVTPAVTSMEASPNLTLQIHVVIKRNKVVLLASANDLVARQAVINRLAGNVVVLIVP